MSNYEKDDLGTRMKGYESVEAMRKLDSNLPICVRLDGKGFSSFTKGMNRPFDSKMQQLMQDTAERLVEETNAVVSYTQSDEISLILWTEEGTEPYFGGRFQKICSTLAAVASVYFNSRLPEFFPEKVKLLPTFDCRAWDVPSKIEACNSILWREFDCSKNSVQMAARSMFSHKQLQDLNCEQMKDKMMREAGIDWNLYPTSFKRGSYFQRVKTKVPFSKEEIDSLPEKHMARTNPELVVERAKIQRVAFPPLNTISNLVEVLFDGKEPVLK